VRGVSFRAYLVLGIACRLNDRLTTIDVLILVLLKSPSVLETWLKEALGFVPQVAKTAILKT